MAKYSESPRLSADYLRKAVPIMNTLGVAVNPMNYSVFYTYIAGKNSALTKEIDRLLEEGERLTRSQSESLFKKYFEEFDDSKIEQFQKKTQKIITELFGSLTRVDSDASQYSGELESFSNRIEGLDAGETLQDLIDQIRASTKNMRRSNATLRQQLKETNGQVDNLKKALQSAKQEALIDPLTGLTNRAGFNLAMDDALSQAIAENKSLCLLMLDIDHFKKVNDAYGHLLGDTVLKIVGMTLQKSVKGKDTACRYGGEEFAILLPDTPVEGAEQLGETIRRAIKSGKIKRNNNKEDVGNITVSLGLAQYKHGENMSEFIERADAALYTSKGNGRNQLTVAE